MMKITIGELYDQFINLAYLIQNESIIPLGKVSLILTYNFNIMGEPLRAYSAYRERLIEKYSDDVIDGKFIIEPNSPNWSKFCEEIKPMNDIEIEVPLVFIPMEDALKSILSDKDSDHLYWFIQEYQDFKLTAAQINEEFKNKFRFA